MRNAFIIILCTLILSSCNEFKKPIKIEDNNQILDSSSVDSSKVKTTYGLNIPEFGRFNLKSMIFVKKHNYGIGDSEGSMSEYTTDKNIIAIDSNSFGEYGYLNTFYLFSKEDSLQRVYQSEWENLHNAGDKYFYVVTEKVYIFKTNSPVLLERKDTIEDHFYLSKKHPEPLSKGYTKSKVSDKNIDYWNNEYAKTWKREYNKDY